MRATPHQADHDKAEPAPGRPDDGHPAVESTLSPDLAIDPAEIEAVIRLLGLDLDRLLG